MSCRCLSPIANSKVKKSYDLMLDYFNDESLRFYRISLEKPTNFQNYLMWLNPNWLFTIINSIYDNFNLNSQRPCQMKIWNTVKPRSTDQRLPQEKPPRSGPEKKKWDKAGFLHTGLKLSLESKYIIFLNDFIANKQVWQSSDIRCVLAIC